MGQAKTQGNHCNMANISTTKMSSKGQVVIPENIRKQLNLKAGTQFVVVGDKNLTPQINAISSITTASRIVIFSAEGFVITVSSCSPKMAKIRVPAWIDLVVVDFFQFRKPAITETFCRKQASL